MRGGTTQDVFLKIEFPTIGTVDYLVAIWLQITFFKLICLDSVASLNIFGPQLLAYDGNLQRTRHSYGTQQLWKEMVHYFFNFSSRNSTICSVFQLPILCAQIPTEAKYILEQRSRRACMPGNRFVSATKQLSNNYAPDNLIFLRCIGFQIELGHLSTNVLLTHDTSRALESLYVDDIKQRQRILTFTVKRS